MIPATGLPSLVDALQSEEATAKGIASRSLDQWLAQGNPWRSRPPTQRPKQQPQRQSAQQSNPQRPEALSSPSEGAAVGKTVDSRGRHEPQPSSASASQDASTPDGDRGAAKGSGIGALAMACGANRWLLQRLCEYCQLMR